MWYLNYCSPFMFKTGTPPQIYRYVMYSELYALFIIYLIITIVYKFFGSTLQLMQKFSHRDRNSQTSTRTQSTMAANSLVLDKYIIFYVVNMGLQ